MREQESYSDLTDLFTAEDRALDPAPFVKEVMTGIRRQSLKRRLILGGVGISGAAVAGVQLPALLAGWTGLDGIVSQMLASTRQDMGILSTVDPLWLTIGGVVTLSLLAVAAMERA